MLLASRPQPRAARPEAGAQPHHEAEAWGATARGAERHPLVGPPYDVAAGPLAQLAEQRTFNPRVVGSIPTGPTKPQVSSLATHSKAFQERPLGRMLGRMLTVQPCSPSLFVDADESGLQASNAAKFPKLLARRPR
jgi:hypothetical protein